MTYNVQRAMAACGAAFLLILGVGLFVANFLPPIPPDLTTEELSQRYLRDTDRIRVGSLIMIIGWGISLPFAAVITQQMRRIEGRHTALGIAQAVAGGVNALAFTVPSIIFAAAVYRPDRDPDVLQGMNDMAWFMLLINITFISIQAAITGIAILSDRNQIPVFPRWVGYSLLWAVVVFWLGYALTFFKTGPFAWDGLLAFWIAFFAFIYWYLVMIWATFRAINAEEREEAAGVTPPTLDPHAVTSS